MMFLKLVLAASCWMSCMYNCPVATIILIGLMSYFSLSNPVDKSMPERNILVTQEATLWQLLFEGLTNN